jgi:hypothetical protein
MLQSGSFTRHKREKCISNIQFSFIYLYIYLFIYLFIVSRDSSIGITTGYGLEDRMIGVRFPAGAGNFFLRHRVQTRSGAHPASYPVDKGATSLGVRRPGRVTDHSPTSNTKVKECMELYFYSPNTVSWRGA